jgi:hypothetical protein
MTEYTTTRDDYTTTRNADGIWVLSVRSIDDPAAYVHVSNHTTEAEAMEAVADAIAEEKRVALSNLATARQRQESDYRNLTALRRLVEDLPWHDINTGDFSPMEGCGDVAAFRAAAAALGCDEDTLNAGAERDYVVTADVTLTVSFLVNATSEEQAHDLGERALADCNWHRHGSLGLDLDSFDIEDTDETVTHVEVSGC